MVDFLADVVDLRDVSDTVMTAAHTWVYAPVLCVPSTAPRGGEVRPGHVWKAFKSAPTHTPDCPLTLLQYCAC
jgi:hypothetical protein